MAAPRRRAILVTVAPIVEAAAVFLSARQHRQAAYALGLAVLVSSGTGTADDVDAGRIVRDAIEHWRGVSSFSEITMVIHRPDWERTMAMRAWTRGDEDSLVRVTEPRKDRGTATLIDGDDMWTYSPKVNRVIKIPSSMMGQSWMGSDFSNKDIAKADDIVDEYDHRLLGSSVEDGVTVYEIEAVPHETAAVVWGREVLRIREDRVVDEHRFYDQDGKLVKRLESLDIGEAGGRTIAIRQRMQDLEAEGEWTEIHVDAVEYGIDVPDSLFTLSNLRNPREEF